MRYLVTMEFIDPGAMLPPEQLAELVENCVIPGEELLASWEQEGRVRGGLHVGERAGSFMIEAASNEELDGLLCQLPFWGLVKTTVRPLQPLPGRIQRDRDGVAQIRGGQP